MSCLVRSWTIISLTAYQRRIVDDVLTLSKLDSGMLPLAIVTADPVGIVRDTLKMFEVEMESFGISYRIDCGTSLRDLEISEIHSDPSRIRQVLINLLTNAIKFTKNGSQRNICISIDASAPKPLEVHLSEFRWFPSKIIQRKELVSC